MTDAPCPHNDEDHPRDSPHHDVLIINPEGVLHHLPVEKRLGHPDEGRYSSPPETTHFRESGHRKVINIAHAWSRGNAKLPEEPSPEQAYGPAFAMLPIKPEPASSNWTCYLINAQRLSFKNPWTVEAWNDEPDPEEQAALGAATGFSDTFELLVAGPQGEVYHLKKEPGQRVPSVASVDLQDEQDIWNQLRNGCVVGTAEFYNQGQPRIVPLVNVTCLMVGARKEGCP